MGYKTTLQKAGWNVNGKILVNKMPWVNEPNHIHRNTSYNSNDLWVIQRQLDNIQACEGDGVILTYRGVSVNGGWDQQVAAKIAFECASRKMLFAYMFDPNLLKGRPNQAISIEQEIINTFNDPSVQEVLNSGAYLPEGYVFDFLTGFNVNWPMVQAAIKGINPLKRNIDYTWACLIDIPSLTAQHNSPNIKVPSFAYGFMDAGCPLPYGATPAQFLAGGSQRDWTQSVWQNVDPSTPDPNNPGKTLTKPARINDPQGGKYFMDCVQSIVNSQYAKNSKYAMLNTWNDYDEGTAAEHMIVGTTGIRIGT